MKAGYYFIFLCLLFWGCEKQWDDPIPEGAVLGTPRLNAQLTEEGKVFLQWDFFRLCAGWMCPHTVEGSRYEVYGKLPGADGFVAIARMGADDMTLMVDNLEYGQAYEFHVKAFRAGHMTTSNRVMIVPNPIPEYETLMALDNWDPILNPKVNSSGDKVAYISNHRWSIGSQDYMTLSLFLLDIAAGQTDLIKLNSYHPQWSADGQWILYGTSDGLNQIAQGYTPSQLEIYQVENQSYQVVVSGLYQQHFPCFGKEDQTVLFLSDSLERGEMGLWITDMDERKDVIWPSFPFPEFGSGMSLFTGMDASYIKDLVVLDNLGTVENRPVYNVYAVEFGEGVQKKEILVSRWNDRVPTLSAFDENLLAFVSDRSGSNQVWTLNLSNGKLNQVSFFQDDIRISTSGTSLSWTDQGQSLVFPISKTGGIQELVKISLSS